MWPDLLHNLYLGNGKDACGASLVLLVECGLYGETRPDAEWSLCFKRMFLAYQQKMRHHRITTSCPAFSIATCNARGVANFEAKAAHIKHVFFFVADELSIAAASDCSTAEVDLAAFAMYNLVQFIQVTDRAALILSVDEANAAYKFGRAYLKSYKQLALLALSTGALRWKVRPKCHYLDHSLRDMRKYRWNPRFFACWCDEDYMGRITRLASRCHRSTVTSTALLRYFILLAHRWMQANAG